MMFLTNLSSINAPGSCKQFREREGSTFKLMCVHPDFLLVLPVTVFQNFKKHYSWVFIELKSANSLKKVNIMQSQKVF